MIRYLVKNNLKLMLRNKWTIGIMILGPIIVIALLASAFEELMQSYEGIDEFKAGYRIEAEMMSDSIEQIKKAGTEAGITFEEYPEGDIKSLMEHNDLAGFVEIDDNDYTVYESADYKVEGITLEYFMHKVMKEVVNQALGQMMPAMEKEEIQLDVEQLDYMPAISAKDYYGIAFIVYFMWCALVCATNVLTSEKKNGINRRFQMSSLSNFRLYLGIWIPVVLAVIIEIILSIAATMLLLGIHWGNLAMSLFIIALTAMASASFGLMIYYICNNLAISIVVLFTSVWFMGFFGGCFETYIFSNYPQVLKEASPIYHINRTLVEYSCMGESSYTKSCIIYLTVIIAVCSLIAVIADGIRKRGRA